MTTLHAKCSSLTPPLFVAISVIILVTLGSWQMQRLAWKQGLLAQIEMGQIAEPLAALPNCKDIADCSELDVLAYRRVALQGTFKAKPVFFRVGHHRHHKGGYYVLAVFETQNGLQLLVNRGFAPGKQAVALAAHLADGAQKQQKQQLQTLNGVMRPARRPRLFTPGDQPEKQLWFSEDTERMNRLNGLALPAMVIEATGERVEGQSIIPNAGTARFRNDHLGYAVTWYLLAITALVMFFFYHRRKTLPPDTPLISK